MDAYLYIGHYYDACGNYILKIGTTNDLKRRKQEHTRRYRKAKHYPIPPCNSFQYDWFIKVSKYNALRYEDLNRKRLQEANIGKWLKNDRFVCGKAPAEITIQIRKTYNIKLRERE